MKLIEVLVRYLPESGGWPVWATRARQSQWDTAIYISNEGDLKGGAGIFDFGIRADDCSFETGDHVTRQQYEAALAASKEMLINKPVAWDGQGLPPLGCVCEINDPIYNAGTKVRVLCHDERAAVCRILEGDRLHSLCQLEATEIRPIRTEAERKRDAAVTAMKQLNIGDYDDPRIIYDAIAAGKIPGVKLEAPDDH